ncbi:hypothetical protein FOA52_002989 [Chlamydomonas sp. UWO 241]|nr:hypothetical protein FOA52_002989 [Chlamydomonas sp. UWO 241]
MDRCSARVGAACTTSADCSGNLVCVSDECAVSPGAPACDWPGHCVGAPCRTNTFIDCAWGLDCLSGTCNVRVNASCNSSADCSVGLTCSAGNCVSGEGSGGTGAAPIVAAVVGTVLGVAALALLLLYWRCRGSRRDQGRLFSPEEPRDDGDGDAGSAEARGRVLGSVPPPVQAWGSAAPVDYASEIELDVDFAKEVEAFLGPLIGVGASGRVYQGTWRGAPVAVKIMTLDKEQQWKDMTKEVELCSRFRRW